MQLLPQVLGLLDLPVSSLACYNARGIGLIRLVPGQVGCRRGLSGSNLRRRAVSWHDGDPSK